MTDTPSEPVDAERLEAEVRTIHRLVRLMHRFDLTAIDLDEGRTRIRLRRRSGDAPAHASAPLPPVAAPIASSAPSAPIAPASPAPAALPVIRSPLIGTYFSARDPDSPPYVNVGAVVREDSVICMIEAMTVFSEIPAGVSGTITEILVKNGEPVEFDQPLFRYSPA
ncbi:MAG: acetyl-CoA carboxylase biotin carboxyl carrier protein [Isosphaeraceae bacterium]